MQKFTILLIIITIYLISCSSSYLNKKDYIKWVENPSHGLKKEKKIESWIFTLQYKPVDYVLMNELNDGSMSFSQIQELKKELEQNQYLTFRIGTTETGVELLKVGVKNSEEYQKRIQYFAFKMQEDLKLVEGFDTLHCTIFHFERAFDLTPFCTFMIGFPISKNIEASKRSKTFIYDDAVFGIGKIQMEIDAKSLESIPNVKN